MRRQRKSAESMMQFFLSSPFIIMIPLSCVLTLFIVYCSGPGIAQRAWCVWIPLLRRRPPPPLLRLVPTSFLPPASIRRSLRSETVPMAPVRIHYMTLSLSLSLCQAEF